MSDEETELHDPFLAALQKTLRPEVLDEAGDKLAQVIDAVNNLGRKGSLTLTLTLDPHERVARAVEVTATIKSKPPEPKPLARIAYAHAGRLHRNDPMQEELPGVRAVPAPEQAEETA